MLKALVLTCFLSLAIGGCSTGTVQEDVSYSLNSIYGAVDANLTMGIQGYSENHREITSRPFMLKQSGTMKRDGYHDRGRAKVVILGNERPYSIEVSVSIERGSKNEETGDIDYSVDRYDQELARKLMRNILHSLDKSTHDKNVIDDFKPF